jgi:addiction module HigA family antidote
MKRLKAPPHPGEVLREYLGDVSVAEAAEKLAVSRSTVSRLLNGASGVSADMAIRLGLALGTSPELWAGLQWKFDLHQASLCPRPKVGRIGTMVKDKSVLDLKGTLCPPAGTTVSIQDMRRANEELALWESVAPVGREFGSPDYERLQELDNLAVKALSSLKRARRWLDAPNSDLGGKTPEAVAKSEQGFKKVKHLLRAQLGA